MALAAIEREHELAPQSLAQRVLVNERFQRAYELSVEPEVELCLDAPFKCGEAKLLEPPAFERKRGDIGDVGERATMPERKSFPKPNSRNTRRASRQRGLPFLDEQLEPSGVNVRLLELEHVAAPTRNQRGIGPQERAQARYVRAERLYRTRRRTGVPKLVD